MAISCPSDSGIRSSARSARVRISLSRGRRCHSLTVLEHPRANSRLNDTSAFLFVFNQNLPRQHKFFNALTCFQIHFEWQIKHTSFDCEDDERYQLSEHYWLDVTSSKQALSVQSALLEIALRCWTLSLQWTLPKSRKKTKHAWIVLWALSETRVKERRTLSTQWTLQMKTLENRSMICQFSKSNM